MISVVISTRNDPIGCLFTVRSLLEEAKGFDGKVEIVIVDNSDKDGLNIGDLIDVQYIVEGKIKLLKESVSCIFSARDKGVEVANGDYIIILDSHMMLSRGAFVSFNKTFAKGDEVGIVYGPLIYHMDTEIDAYHSRDIRTFMAVKFREVGWNCRKIPFRGAPFGMKKSLYQEIQGYGTLAKEKYSWGGGDAYMGIKSLLFGKVNYLVENFAGIHIGPFKRDPFLCRTSEYARTHEGGRWMGILVAGYILGGETLLQQRVKRIQRRLKRFEDFSERSLHNIRLVGEGEKRWIKDNAKFTFEEIQEQWQNVS